MKRENRPNWRKVRGWGRKMVRDKHGRPVRVYGKIKFNNIKIKTKEWEKV